MRMRGESVLLLYLQIECLVDEIAHGVMDRTESTVPVAQMCDVADGKIVVSIHQNIGTGGTVPTEFAEWAALPIATVNQRSYSQRI